MATNCLRSNYIKKEFTTDSFFAHFVENSICFAFVCLFIYSAIERISRENINILDSVLIFSILRVFVCLAMSMKNIFLL